MYATIGQQAHLKVDTRRYIQPMKSLTHFQRNTTDPRQLQDKTRSGTHNSIQLSQKICRSSDQQSVTVIKSRQDHGPNKRMTGVFRKRLTYSSQLTYVIVQRAGQTGDMFCKRHRGIDDDPQIPNGCSDRNEATSYLQRTTRAVFQPTHRAEYYYLSLICVEA